MLEILQARFFDNPRRHSDMTWEAVERRLKNTPEALEILRRMEDTGGEPDAVGIDGDTGKIIFCDCATESPAGRRSLCYDDEALRKRVRNPPAGSAVRQAREMGVELMTEAFYRFLQAHGEYDLKTSSWIATPDPVRRQGGALFCERRYGVVFTFHNGADSYYVVRGWRGVLKV